jgi:HTH-type transcriptional regulator, sugar sensing transcriptional regulator
MKKVLDRLQSLGFSANEAKVYLALLKEHPLTGYEIANKSGIQRASVYQVIGRLADKGMVHEVRDNGGRQFMPETPEKMVVRLKQEFTDASEVVTEFARHYKKTVDYSDHYLSINNYEDTLVKIREMVNKSRKEILISTGWVEIRMIRDVLKAAHDRKVGITIFSFSKIPLGFGTIHSHELDEEKTRKAWKYRRLILVTDHSEILIAQSEPDQKFRTLWTRNGLLVDIGFEHITHDIYLLELQRKMNIEVPEDLLVSEHRLVKENIKSVV